MITSNSFPQKDQLLCEGQLMEGQLVLFSVTVHAGRTIILFHRILSIVLGLIDIKIDIKELMNEW